MILTGQDTVRANRFNYLKKLKDNIEVDFKLTNRYTNEDGGAIIPWGDAILLGVDSLGEISAGDDIKIFSSTSSTEFTVLQVSDHWLLITMEDTTLASSFLDYMDSTNPDSTQMFVSDGTKNYFIRANNQATTYKNLNVTMKALDGLSESVEFGNMKMIADQDGSIIIYNLSAALFSEVESKNIDNILFDLCIENDAYTPILRGLKYVEKISDLNYLTFSYYTNTGKKYIYFTTKSIISDYAIYPDIVITDNLYNNLANDYRLPSLFTNMMNDIHVSEIMEFNDPGIPSGLTDTVNTFKWVKEIFEDDILSHNVTYAGVFANETYTVLDHTTYATSSGKNLFLGRLGAATTQIIISKSGSTYRYTYNSVGAPLACQTYLETFCRVHISGDIDAEYQGSFSVTAVGSDWFEVDNSTASNSGETVLLGADTAIQFNHSFIKSYDNKMFQISYTDVGAKQFSLNNLMCEFEVTHASGSDYDIRMLQLYDNVNNELLYMTYFTLMRFYIGITKTFRIVL